MSGDLAWSLTPTPGKQEETSKGGVWLDF